MKATIFALCTLFVTSVQARVLYFGTEPEDVNITQGGSTLFRFEKPVKTISRAGQFQIQPADPEDPDYSFLKVVPRGASGSNNVAFILSDGTVVNARIVVVPDGARTDSVYDFKSKASLVTHNGKSQVPFVTKIDLMKALIRDDIVTGYKIEKQDTLIRTGVDGIEARLIRTYIGQDENGFIYKLQNVSRSKHFHIDVRKLTLGQPNLAILSQVSRDFIGPHKTGEDVAYLRVVAKPASLYRRVTLPITWEEKN